MEELDERCPGIPLEQLPQIGSIHSNHFRDSYDGEVLHAVHALDDLLHLGYHR
ncbi:hypothetical protein SDC9_82969 [bioreactor metagenome]|uniref:Uncharacterized protein n=1 Tax=bioreactor metagenome TaxID=1076179 RepID=A0A644ZCC9_9ZZZZ